MKIKITKIAFILSFILSCVACSEDKLSGNSVINENRSNRA